MYERAENSIELTYLRRFILPLSNINDFSLKRIETNFINRKIPKRTISVKLSNEQLNRSTLSLNSSLIHEESISDELIRSLALSPNEETLLVGTNKNHLYEIAFSKMV